MCWLLPDALPAGVQDKAHFQGLDVCFVCTSIGQGAAWLCEMLAGLQLALSLQMQLQTSQLKRLSLSCRSSGQRAAWLSEVLATWLAGTQAKSVAGFAAMC